MVGGTSCTGQVTLRSDAMCEVDPAMLAVRLAIYSDFPQLRSRPFSLPATGLPPTSHLTAVPSGQPADATPSQQSSAPWHRRLKWADATSELRLLAVLRECRDPEKTTSPFNGWRRCHEGRVKRAEIYFEWGGKIAKTREPHRNPCPTLT